MNELTLIVTYRNRPEHLQIFIEQWDNQYSKFCNLIFIEDSDEPSKIGINLNNNCVYKFIRSDSELFHKSRLLNIALNEVKTKYFLIYDIDLISNKNALEKHLFIAKQNETCVIAGYRLNIKYENLNKGYYYLDETSVSSENKPSALLKYLLYDERFGVNPIYQTEIAKKIKGFDENFLGWGCEDQDFLERYLKKSGFYLLHSFDLLYFHIDHKHETTWKSEEIITRNREIYYNKKKNDN